MGAIKDGLVVVLLAMAAFAIGIIEGSDFGMEAIHRGSWQCETMPDERVECWKVDK